MKHSSPNRSARFFFAVLVVATIASTIGTTNVRAAAESPVFKTGFDSEEAFLDAFQPRPAADWAVADGVLTAQGNGVDSARAKQPADPDCKVEADVTLVSDNGKGGFSGVILGGVIFHALPGGFRYAYHTRGEAKEQSQMQDRIVEYGKTYHWEITRETHADGCAFTWRVDGETVAGFTVLNPIEGESDVFTLMANRMTTRFYNVALRRFDPSK